MVYRILFAEDGKHWIDNKVNNRRDPSAAVMEINTHIALNPFAACKLVNPKTGQVIYERKGAKAE